MRRHSPHLDAVAAAAVAATLLLAACSTDSTGPAPGEQADFQAANDALALATTLGLPGALAEDGGAATSERDGCTYAEAEGRWYCGPVERNGLVFTHSYAFYDASGASQRRFDRLTTAAINRRSSVKGTTTRDGATITVDRTADLTASGLAGEETQRTLNGVEGGTTVRVTTGDFGTRTVTTVSRDRTADVVVPVPRTRETWPLSGQSIRYHEAEEKVEGASTGSRTSWERTVITYNGTRLVPIEITNARGTRVCTLNLATGERRCATR